MVNCFSLAQTCLLGPPPPRVPGRADPQVPSEEIDAHVKYGKIPYLYFYADGQNDNAAFGFLDIELALYPMTNGKVCFELYCIGDGYQSGTGRRQNNSLVIDLRSGSRTLESIKWEYPDVLEGHADPIHYSTVIPLPDSEFDLADTIFISPAKGSIS